jgi:hypothetical protein
MSREEYTSRSRLPGLHTLGLERTLEIIFHIPAYLSMVHLVADVDVLEFSAPEWSVGLPRLCFD